MGDCTGHGLGAALMAALLKAISDRHMGTLADGRPADFLKEVNRDIAGYIWEGEFPVMLAATIDPDGVLRYANANHPLPILVRSGEAVDLPPVPGMHLGYDVKWPFEEAHCTTRPGDRLVFFSDAPIEVHREGHVLGRDQFRDLLLGLSHSPDTALTELLERLRNRAGGFPLGDDLSVVLVDHGVECTLQWSLHHPGELEAHRATFHRALAQARWGSETLDPTWTRIETTLKRGLGARSPSAPSDFTLRLWIDGEKVVLGAEGPALRISETILRKNEETRFRPEPEMAANIGISRSTS